MTAPTGGDGAALGDVWVGVVPSLAGSQSVLQAAARAGAEQYARAFEDAVAPAMQQVMGRVGSSASQSLGAAMSPALRSVITDAITAIAPEAGKAFTGLTSKMTEAAKAGSVGIGLAVGTIVIEEFRHVTHEFEKVGSDAANVLVGGFDNAIKGKAPDIMGALNVFEDGAKAVTASLGLVAPLAGLAFAPLFAAFDKFKEVTGPVVADMVQVGDQYLELTRTLASSTLDTEQIEGLSAAVRDIMASGAVVHFKDVAESIGRLNANIKGLDTTQLKELTTTLAEAEELVGHIDTTKFAGILNAWNVPAGEANETLTMLVNTARATGIEFNTLADEMQRIGPAMRELGYNTEDTASFFALLTQQGEKGTRLIFGMNEAVTKLNDLVEKGVFKSVKEGWESIIPAVQELSRTNPAEALGLLKGYFTPSTAPLMLEAIEKGLIKVGQAGVEIEGVHEQLGEAVEKTKSLGQTFEVVGQQISAAMAPIGGAMAAGLRDAGNHVSDWLKENQVKLAGWAEEIVSTFLHVMTGATQVFGTMILAAAPVLDAFTQMFRMTMDNIFHIVAPISEAFANVFGGRFRQLHDELDKAHEGLDKLGQFSLTDWAGKGMDKVDEFANNTLPKIDKGLKNTYDGFAKNEAISKAFEETLNGVADQPGWSALANPGGVGLGGTAESPNLRLQGDPAQRQEIIEWLRGQGINLTENTTGVVTGVTFGGNGVSKEEAQKNWDAWFQENVIDPLGKKPTTLKIDPQHDGKTIQSPSDLFSSTTSDTPLQVPIQAVPQSPSGPSPSLAVPGLAEGGVPWLYGTRPGVDGVPAIVAPFEHVYTASDTDKINFEGMRGQQAHYAMRAAIQQGATLRAVAGGGEVEQAIQLKMGEGFLKGLGQAIGLDMPWLGKDHTGGPFLPGSSPLPASPSQALGATASHAGNVKEQAHAALLALGGSEADWPKLDYIFSHESSWKTSNPNNWDINAQKGDRSDGLGQLTRSNMRTYGRPGADPNTTDPYDQTVAAINYMRHRYGSIDGAYQYWLGHHNYAGGGAVGGQSWFGSSPHERPGPNTASIAKHFAHLAGGGPVCGFCGGGHPTMFHGGGEVKAFAGGGAVGSKEDMNGPAFSQVIWRNTETNQDIGEAGGQWVGTPGSADPGYYHRGHEDFPDHTGHVHTTVVKDPFTGAPYNEVLAGSDIGHGHDTAKFPAWVTRLADQWGLDPKTYPKHQEWNGINHGIDWYPKGKINSDLSDRGYTHQDHATLTSFAQAVGQSAINDGGAPPPGGGGGGGNVFSAANGVPGGPGGDPNITFPSVPGYSPPQIGPGGPMPASGPNPFSSPLANPDQQSRWQSEWERRQSEIGDANNNLAKATNDLAEARQKSAELQPQWDAANNIYQQHLQELKGMFPGKTDEELRELDPLLKQQYTALKDLTEKLKPIIEELDKGPTAIQNANNRVQELADQGFPKPGGGKEFGNYANMSDALGRGLVQGIFQQLGFPDVFGKPFTEWGLWKLGMGALGFGLGVADQKGLFNGGPSAFHAALPDGVPRLPGPGGSPDTFNGLPNGTPGSPASPSTPSAGLTRIPIPGQPGQFGYVDPHGTVFSDPEGKNPIGVYQGPDRGLLPPPPNPAAAQSALGGRVYTEDQWHDLGFDQGKKEPPVPHDQPLAPGQLGSDAGGWKHDEQKHQYVWVPKNPSQGGGAAPPTPRTSAGVPQNWTYDPKSGFYVDPNTGKQRPPGVAYNPDTHKWEAPSGLFPAPPPPPPPPPPSVSAGPGPGGSLSDLNKYPDIWQHGGGGGNAAPFGMPGLGSDLFNGTDYYEQSANKPAPFSFSGNGPAVGGLGPQFDQIMAQLPNRLVKMQDDANPNSPSKLVPPPTGRAFVGNQLFAQQSAAYAKSTAEALNGPQWYDKMGGGFVGGLPGGLDKFANAALSSIKGMPKDPLGKTADQYTSSATPSSLAGQMQAASKLPNTAPSTGPTTIMNVNNQGVMNPSEAADKIRQVSLRDSAWKGPNSMFAMGLQIS